MERLIKDNLIEFDFIDGIAIVWKRKKIIISLTIIFFFIGLIVAISSPIEYTASTVIVPQSGEKKAAGSISGLAAIAGINIGSLNSGEVLSPTLYPIILSNFNFQKELLYTEFSFNNMDHKVTYYDYYSNKKNISQNIFFQIKDYIVGLPSRLIRSFNSKSFKKNTSSKNNDIQLDSFSYNEFKIVEKLMKNLTLKINEKDGFITLSYKSNEKNLSAEIVDKVYSLLQKYIIEFKLDKVAKNLQFVERSFDEAKMKFEDKQIELANYRDSNKFLSSAIAKTHEEKLISEYNLLLGIYTELAKQKEQAKIAVTETTPILTIIQPVTIPIEKSGPNRTIITLSFTIFGIIISIISIYISPYIKLIYSKFTEDNPSQTFEI